MGLCPYIFWYLLGQDYYLVHCSGHGVRHPDGLPPHIMLGKLQIAAKHVY
jgi:hypothetical protein